MKPRAILPILVISGICVLLEGSATGADAPPPRSVDIPYVYPVKLNTKEWRDLPGPMACKIALQVPRAVVDSLTTKALLETYFDYVFLGAPLISINPLSSVKGAAVELNSLRELLRREDLLKELARYLSRLASDYSSPSKTSARIEAFKLNAILGNIAIIVELKNFSTTASVQENRVLLESSLRAYEALVQAGDEDAAMNLFWMIRLFGDKPDEAGRVYASTSERTQRFKEVVRSFGD